MPSRTFKTKTKQELDFLLNDKVFNKADVIQVVEVFMDKFVVGQASQLILGLSLATDCSS
jgi:hypothetical protein